MNLDKNMTLGEFLRHERERRGVTLEQVASSTKVGVRTLHALESDHYSELPAKPFIRGFVTSYCRFIGLDAKEILNQFDDYLSQKAFERPNREAGHSGYAFEKKDGEQGRTLLLFAICGFVLVGVVAMLVLKPSLRHRHSSHIDKLRAAHTETPKKEPVVSPSVQPVSVPTQAAQSEDSAAATTQVAEAPVTNATPSPEASAKSSPTSTPSAAPPTQAGANPADPLDSGMGLKAGEIHHKVVFKTLADIWVRYQVDERPMRKFIVRKGRTLILRAQDSIRVQVSNPNSVNLNYNGQGTHLMGSDTKIQTIKGDATLYFPEAIAEKFEKPFGEEPTLPKTQDPTVDLNTQANSPAASPSP